MSEQYDWIEVVIVSPGTEGSLTMHCFAEMIDFSTASSSSFC